jgi:hypothetical protein
VSVSCFLDLLHQTYIIIIIIMYLVLRSTYRTTDSIQDRLSDRPLVDKISSRIVPHGVSAANTRQRSPYHIKPCYKYMEDATGEYNGTNFDTHRHRTLLLLLLTMILKCVLPLSSTTTISNTSPFTIICIYKVIQTP